MDEGRKGEGVGGPKVVGEQVNWGCLRLWAGRTETGVFEVADAEATPIVTTRTSAGYRALRGEKAKGRRGQLFQ